MKHWNDIFLDLFSQCCERYRSGQTDYTRYYSADDLVFLGQIGCQPREFFDFVEDYCDEGRPSPGTALLVAAVRRDFFIVVQDSAWSRAEKLSAENVPSFGEELEEMAYLPRILTKARAKLRGELDPDLMFGCGGDRNFLRKHGNIHPADFLRQVWAAGADDLALARWVKTQCHTES
jgi:hypothetical protein